MYSSFRPLSAAPARFSLLCQVAQAELAPSTEAREGAEAEAEARAAEAKEAEDAKEEEDVVSVPPAPRPDPENPPWSLRLAPALGEAIDPLLTPF
eukprot:970058-Prorocentrum_minimum.AAC.1